MRGSGGVPVDKLLPKRIEARAETLRHKHRGTQAVLSLVGEGRYVGRRRSRAAPRRASHRARASSRRAREVKREDEPGAPRGGDDRVPGRRARELLNLLLLTELALRDELAFQLRDDCGRGRVGQGRATGRGSRGMSEREADAPSSASSFNRASSLPMSETSTPPKNLG